MNVLIRFGEYLDELGTILDVESSLEDSLVSMYREAKFYLFVRCAEFMRVVLCEVYANRGNDIDMVLAMDVQDIIRKLEMDPYRARELNMLFNSAGIIELGFAMFNSCGADDAWENAVNCIPLYYVGMREFAPSKKGATHEH